MKLADRTPMGTEGLDIDPITGEPEDREVKKAQAEFAKKENMARIISRRDDLIEDITGPGQPLLKMILKEFANRVDQLIADDPQCKSYISIFNSIGLTVRMGDKYAGKIEKMIFAEK